MCWSWHLFIVIEQWLSHRFTGWWWILKCQASSEAVQMNDWLKTVLVDLDSVSITYIRLTGIYSSSFREIWHFLLTSMCIAHTYAHRQSNIRETINTYFNIFKSIIILNHWTNISLSYKHLKRTILVGLQKFHIL